MLRFTRWWLPALICAAGLIVIVARGGDETGMEGGAAIIGAGLSVLLLNYLHRLGVSGDAERSGEDDARAYFDEHGYWPGEGPDVPPAAPEAAAAQADRHAAPHKVAGAPHGRPPRR